MPETTFLFLKALLMLASVFALVGVSWYLMKLLAKTTDTLEEFRQTNKRVNKLVDSVSQDYEYIRSTIRSLSVTVDKLNKDVLSPIVNVAQIFKTVEGAVHGMLFRIKDSNEPEDYLPEEV